jgi:hypothetical protein
MNQIKSTNQSNQSINQSIQHVPTSWYGLPVGVKHSPSSNLTTGAGKNKTTCKRVEDTFECNNKYCSHAPRGLALPTFEDVLAHFSDKKGNPARFCYCPLHNNKNKSCSTTMLDQQSIIVKHLVEYHPDVLEKLVKFTPADDVQSIKNSLKENGTIIYCTEKGYTTMLPKTACSFGTRCNLLNDAKHMKTFSHNTKQACKFAEKCTKQNDASHNSMYSHGSDKVQNEETPIYITNIETVVPLPPVTVVEEVQAVPVSNYDSWNECERIITPTTTIVVDEDIDDWESIDVTTPPPKPVVIALPPVVISPPVVVEAAPVIVPTVVPVMKWNKKTTVAPSLASIIEEEKSSIVTKSIPVVHEVLPIASAPVVEKKLCKFHHCTKRDDPAHLAQFFHERTPCKFYNCNKKNDAEHCTYFSHEVVPVVEKKLCKFHHCIKRDDPSHMALFYHELTPCKFHNCNKKNDPTHTAHFSH